MSERKSSPEDEARHNARLNILQALGSARALSSPQAADDGIEDGKSKFPVTLDVHIETKVSSLPPPLSPKPRSPRTSPTNRL